MTPRLKLEDWRLMDQEFDNYEIQEEGHGRDGALGEGDGEHSFVGEVQRVLD